ncbi:MAG: tyrosine-protein phosphatase [Planctomycetota bacterium]|nr:tyrosine-protein phosphatase [Planctomycetota bacterium]
MASGRTKKKRQRIAIVLVLVAAVAATTAAITLQFTRLPKRFAVVDSGILYRSAQPSTRQIENLVEDHGIKTIMIVREGTSDRVPDEIEFARSIGLNVVHVPIASRKSIPDEHVDQFYKCLDDPANRPVLIHCSAGRHRTGYLCALYRIERQGWTIERAIDELKSFRFDENDHVAVLKQLENYEPRTSAGGPAGLQP